jgi:hypothetical protein
MGFRAYREKIVEPCCDTDLLSVNVKFVETIKSTAISVKKFFPVLQARLATRPRLTMVPQW